MCGVHIVVLSLLLVDATFKRKSFTLVCYAEKILSAVRQSNFKSF